MQLTPNEGNGWVNGSGLATSLSETGAQVAELLSGRSVDFRSLLGATESTRSLRLGFHGCRNVLCEKSRYLR
jgi:hypothetical protein